MKRNVLTKLTGMAVSALMLGTTMTPVLAADISVKTGDTHTYDVYQIFTGDYDETSNVLSNIKWGENGTETSGTVVAEDVLNALTAVTESTSDREKLEVIEKYANMGGTAYVSGVTSEKSASEVLGDELPEGYYIIVDTTNVEGTDDAISTYIVQVVDDVEINAKKATPSFDKDVMDDDTNDATETGETTGVSEADAANNTDGWGETADHQINESFQFRLTASIPNDTDFDAYASYYLQFNDTMSAGVTYEGIASVTVTAGGETIALADADYTLEGITAGTAGGSFTLTINDLKSVKDTSGNPIDIKGAVVEVLYNAHLNENAAIATGKDTDDDNRNTGFLVYSNNPNEKGEGTPSTGKTPEDTVFVFTYEVDNVKIDAASMTENGSVEDATVLKKAEFRLYTDEEKTNEVALVYDDNLKAYRPVNSQESGTVMVSDDNGKFNVAGLDAGTYYLVETKAPAGYNLDETPIAVTISAAHQQTASTAASVTFADDSANKTVQYIRNKKGSNLPETGGMGTTVIYTAGAVLVIGAGALLVVRKKKEETAE